MLLRFEVHSSFLISHFYLFSFAHFLLSFLFAFHFCTLYFLCTFASFFHPPERRYSYLHLHLYLTLPNTLLAPTHRTPLLLLLYQIVTYTQVIIDGL